MGILFTKDLRELPFRPKSHNSSLKKLNQHSQDLNFLRTLWFLSLKRYEFWRQEACINVFSWFLFGLLKFKCIYFFFLLSTRCFPGKKSLCNNCFLSFSVINQRFFSRWYIIYTPGVTIHHFKFHKLALKYYNSR